jgi:hypothetical protein
MSLVSRDSLVLFERALKDKYMEIRGRLHKESRGDPANVSASWNAYIKGVGGRVVRGKGVTHRTVKRIVGGKVENQSRRKNSDPDAIFRELLDLLNFNNDQVSGKVMIANPDRIGQWLLVPSDVVERVLVLGLP